MIKHRLHLVMGDNSNYAFQTVMDSGEFATFMSWLNGNSDTRTFVVTPTVLLYETGTLNVMGKSSYILTDPKNIIFVAHDEYVSDR